MGNNNKRERGVGRARVYNFMVEFIKNNGYAPSVREICTGTDLSSTSSVYNHLLKMNDEGKIKMKQGYSPRAIKLVSYKFVKVEELEQ